MASQSTPCRFYVNVVEILCTYNSRTGEMWTILPLGRNHVSYCVVENIEFFIAFDGYLDQFHYLNGAYAARVQHYRKADRNALLIHHNENESGDLNGNILVEVNMVESKGRVSYNLVYIPETIDEVKNMKLTESDDEKN